MAQTISVLTVSNTDFEVVEVLGYAPSVEEIEGIAEANEMFGEIEGRFQSYNIGEGESGTDFFFDEEELKEMWLTGEFEKKVEEKGYSIEWYQSDTLYTELEAEEEE